MKSSKYLKKQSIKAASLSFQDGVLDESSSAKFLKAFKKLPLGEAIPALNFYLQAIKREVSKVTLTITSSAKLSADQIKTLEKELKSSYKIQKTEEQITPSILGGIQVKIGDIVFDGSLKQKLEQLKGAING